MSAELTGDELRCPIRVSSLHLYPLKSGAGLTPDQVRLDRTGFESDRCWMLTGPDGRFLTQRELPRMGLIRAEVLEGRLWLRLPGDALAWAVADSLVAPGQQQVQQAQQVRIWDDTLCAREPDPDASRRLSSWLGHPVRLVAFEPDKSSPRLSSRRWTGDLAAENAFSDGFPILVISTASLDELNRRLIAAQHPAVTMARFRPNLVLDLGEELGAHGEDSLDTLHLDGPDGAVVLKLVKPCPRCPVPNLDPLTAEAGSEPGLTLSGYRADARVGGAITFGMNAVIVEGFGRRITVGTAGSASVVF
jgi:uncharacterized protein YcbX